MIPNLTFLLNFLFGVENRLKSIVGHALKEQVS